MTPLSSTAYPEAWALLDSYFGFDITPYTRLVRFDAGELLAREGETLSTLYYMVSGRGKITVTHENGRVSLIQFLKSPCFVGEMELLGVSEETKTVQAITPCVCFAIQTGLCRDQLLRDNRFLRRLCQFMGGKMQEYTRHFTQNLSYPLEARLAAFLLEMSHDGWYREPHTETAEFLGVSYRHLLYVLADFVKRGLVRKESGAYFLTNPAALRALTENRT